MRILLKPLQWLYCLYAYSLFILLMLPVFLWALLTMPFGNIRGGNLLYRACTLWGDIWFPLIFIRCKNIYEEGKPEERSAIFVSNHISYLDAAFIVMAFRKPLRPLGKAELSKIPLFGFIYRRMIVSVDRSSAGNRAKSVQVLKSLLRKGISVLVFPEGTFNETGAPLKSFYDGAFRIAIETGSPVVPVLFLDAYDRMHYRSVFSLTPGPCRALHMAPVETTGLVLKDLPQLRDKVYNIMEEKLIELRASWINEKD